MQTRKYLSLIFISSLFSPSPPSSPSSQLPEDFQVVYTQVQGEVAVGGVFLRLFISQPTWVLRKPKEFLIALLEKFGQLTQSSNPDVRIISLTSFFSYKLCEKGMWVTALGFACGSLVYCFVEMQRFVNCAIAHLTVLSHKYLLVCISVF